MSVRSAVRLLVAILTALTAVIAPAAPSPSRLNPAPAALNPPLVGFTFSPNTLPATTNPEWALETLLTSLQPDIVRLPVYWDVVAPTPDGFDYSAVDSLIETVQAHNTRPGARQTRVVLVVGARNIVYPEVHLPSWLGTQHVHDLEQLLDTASYHRYLETTFQRYAQLPLLYAWQVENEPFDNVGALRQVPNSALSFSMIQSEVDLLESIDPIHQVVVTTFNSAHVSLDARGASPMAWLFRNLPGPKPAGHPAQALTAGDALGLDLYVVTGSAPTTLPVTRRISWKVATLDFWNQQAQKQGKSLWLTEMQAAPWYGTTAFKVQDLLASALAYQGHGISVYLLWGVESYLTAPNWMSAGITSINLLRRGA